MKEGDELGGAMALSQSGETHIPQRYVLPPSQRPGLKSLESSKTFIPTINISSVSENLSRRSQVVNEIRIACQELGFFQVIGHGISALTMRHALEAAEEFFKLPVDEKMLLCSDDIHKPVRYGTSLNHVRDKVYFWRDFLKHYSHPLPNWLHLWPSNPPTYKEKMASYTKEVHILQKQLMELIFESLGLNPNHLHEKVNEGSQVLAVNYYPPCPEPELTLGIPPHSDFGSVTVLLQTRPGLQILSNPSSSEWITVRGCEGVLFVQLGDQMEVMSNGRYKSVVHRATVSASGSRISLASLHSLPMDEKIGPAPELVDEKNPSSYEEFSFQDFLDFASGNDITKGRFIETLKKKNGLA